MLKAVRVLKDTLRHPPGSHAESLVVKGDRDFRLAAAGYD